MADDAAADLGDGLDAGGEAPAKKGGLKGAFPALLKWILIALAAVIFIITVVFIAVRLMTNGIHRWIRYGPRRLIRFHRAYPFR